MSLAARAYVKPSELHHFFGDRKKIFFLNEIVVLLLTLRTFTKHKYCGGAIKV